MRAVNLIPPDQRPGAAGRAGRSGGAVYVVLGGLAALALMVGLWAMAGSRLSSDRAELARLQAETSAAQARAGRLASAGDIRTLRSQRTQVVRTLAAARVDWAKTLDALARTLPSDTWLDSVTASVAPGAGPAGGAGGAAAVASAASGPSIQITGCSPSQARVARLMPRLRTVPGVERVSLVSSTAAEPGAGTAGSSGGCTRVSFGMVLFFAARPGAAAAATGVPAAPAPGAAAAPTTSVSQPTAGSGG